MRSAVDFAREKMKNGWDVEAAISTYNVDGWGTGYFNINAAGNAEVRPLQDKGGAIDILDVVNEARERGLSFPLVIRFQDLLRHESSRSTARSNERSMSSVTRITIGGCSPSR